MGNNVSPPGGASVLTSLQPLVANMRYVASPASRSIRGGGSGRAERDAGGSTLAEAAHLLCLRMRSPSVAHYTRSSRLPTDLSCALKRDGADKASGSAMHAVPTSTPDLHAYTLSRLHAGTRRGAVGCAACASCLLQKGGRQAFAWCLTE